MWSSIAVDREGRIFLILVVKLKKTTNRRGSAATAGVYGCSERNSVISTVP